LPLFSFRRCLDVSQKWFSVVHIERVEDGNYERILKAAEFEGSDTIGSYGLKYHQT
jgi:hypothetical protein